MSYGVLNDRGLAEVDLETLKREYRFLTEGYQEERTHCEKVMAFNRKLQDEKAAIIKYAGTILATEESVLDRLIKEIARADKAEAERNDLTRALDAQRMHEEARQQEVQRFRERCAELESRLDIGTGNMYDVVVEENEKLRTEIETLKETIRDNEAYFMEQKRAFAILHANAQMERKETARWREHATMLFLALNNLRLAAANDMRHSNSVDDDKVWAALEDLTKRIMEAQSAVIAHKEMVDGE